MFRRGHNIDYQYSPCCLALSCALGAFVTLLSLFIGVCAMCSMESFTIAHSLALCTLSAMPTWDDMVVNAGL